MSMVAPATESDRATQALVRRTLCPQQTRDKETQLPPLTSRNDVDVELYALLAIVLREYVQRWYGNMTTDETFVAEIVHVVAHCSRALEQRLRKLDLVRLLLDELPELVDQHVSAYRSAQDSLVQAPLVIDLHQAYHALCPFPPLDVDEGEKEADYRQLLVYALLAVLLPTEDLENPCLTALVGQIFSELVVGNLVIGKAAQPWLILEGICIMGRTLEHKSPSAKVPLSAQGSVVQTWLRSMVKLAVVLLSWIWFLVGALATSSSLPPRGSCASSSRAKTPVLEFAAWRCAGNLLELGSRMPWLEGFLSLARFGAIHGPGHVAAVDGAVDRLLAHHLDTLLSPSRLSAGLRALRGAVFPNNAPGSSSLSPPSSEAELKALRRRAAVALWRMVPSSAAGRVYLAAGSDDDAVNQVEELLLVLSDVYCNKHLLYAALELLLVRLMPELSERGVAELWEERLG